MLCALSQSNRCTCRSASKSHHPCSLNKRLMGFWHYSFGLLQRKKPWGKRKFMILKCVSSNITRDDFIVCLHWNSFFYPQASPLRKFPHKWDIQLHHSYDLWSIYVKKPALGIKWEMNHITVCVTSASPPPSFLLHCAIHMLLETNLSMSWKS